MTTTRIVLACCGVFAAGATIGGGAIWMTTSLSTGQAIAYNAAAGIGGKIFVLEALRGGDSSKASAMLESMLDSDLVVLNLVPETTINPPMKRVVGRAADYRVRYPYKSGDPVVDSAVSDILSKYRIVKDQEK